MMWGRGNVRFIFAVILAAAFSGLSACSSNAPGFNAEPSDPINLNQGQNDIEAGQEDGGLVVIPSPTPSSDPVDGNPPTGDSDAPADVAEPDEPLPPPAQPPINTTPVTTCYRFGFVSARGGNAENVYFGDTCKSLSSGFSVGGRIPPGDLNLQPITGISDLITAGGPKKLTANSNTDKYYGHLAFSPDGSKMVFGEARYSDSFFTPDAFIGDPSGSTPFIGINTYLGTGFSPDPFTINWNRDGTLLAFLGYEDVVVGPDPLEDVVYVKEVYIYDPSNMRLTTAIANNLTTVDFEKVLWHPTLEKLLISQKRNSLPYQMKIYDPVFERVDSLFQRFDTQQIPLEGFQQDVTRNGQTMAFVRIVSGRQQVFKCDFYLRANSAGDSAHTCENVVQLTSLRTNNQPSWTPDGAYIFFTSDREGYRAIYKMKADGSEEARVTPEGVVHHAPAVHPISYTANL